jgi:hypothetical protein
MELLFYECYGLNNGCSCFEFCVYFQKKEAGNKGKHWFTRAILKY